ncbi:hypothetical protein [Lentibacter algarum]|uniref:capsular polysaccharide export protein, LipB/KpsS family n=1 Tax=Lentibacter algarum TaxID=576131 RepID=UPI00339D5092
MILGLSGFDATITAAIKGAYAGELLTLEDLGFDMASSDKGLVDLNTAYPIAPVHDLTVDQLRLLKADFDHYSTRRRLILNHEEQNMLFLHILARLADYLDRVNALLLSNLPHQGTDAILSRLAQIRSVPVWYFTPSIFDGYAYLSKSCNKFYKELEKNANPPQISIDNTAKQSVTYMDPVSGVPPIKRLGSKLNTFREFRQYSKDYAARLFLRPLLSRHFHRAYRRMPWQKDFHPDHSADHLNIYFPLHLQPELTTSFMGQAYSDQCLAISTLVAVLKSQDQAFTIYVKENPKQSFDQRQFLHLLQSDEVIMIDRTVPSNRLIEECDIVATITGTAGWEAVKSGKPALIFGTTWYENAPGVIVFDDLLTQKALISKAPVDSALVNQWFSAHLSALHAGQFDPDQKSFAPFFDRSVDTVVGILDKMNEGRA